MHRNNWAIKGPNSAILSYLQSFAIRHLLVANWRARLFGKDFQIDETGNQVPFTLIKVENKYLCFFQQNVSFWLSVNASYKWKLYLVKLPRKVLDIEIRASETKRCTSGRMKGTDLKLKEGIGRSTIAAMTISPSPTPSRIVPDSSSHTEEKSSFWNVPWDWTFPFNPRHSWTNRVFSRKLYNVH